MPEEVRATHLLLKHTGSRNPVSRRTNARISMSKEEALAELTKLRAEIMATSDPQRAFKTLAHERSDCGSFSRDGDLGAFGRGQMQRPFEEATFALDIGQISDVVDTDSGLHIILRLPL